MIESAFRGIGMLHQILESTTSLTISDILVIVGFLLAWDQYRKKVTASAAVVQLKRTMLKQRSVQYFDELSRKAAMLSAALRSKNWDEVSELVTQLGGLISSASGFSQVLILESENEELTRAGASLKLIWDGIPVNPQAEALSDEQIKGLMKHCILIVYAIEKVGGRMKYIGELEADEEQKKKRDALWPGKPKWLSKASTQLPLKPEGELPVEVKQNE
jgi:hypothetical protein